MQEIAAASSTTTCAAGSVSNQVSFQHVSVPLLRLLTQPGIESSILSHAVNPLYAVRALPGQ